MGFKKWYSLGATDYTYVQGQVQQYVPVFWEYGFSSGATFNGPISPNKQNLMLHNNSIWIL